MPRPKPAIPASKSFAIRITEDDDKIVDQLAALDAAEHRESPNRTAWFRRLIYREALYRRLLPEQSSAPAAAPSAAAVPTRTKAGEQ